MKTIKIPTENGQYKEVKFPVKLDENQMAAMLDCILYNDLSVDATGALCLKWFQDISTVSDDYIKFLATGLLNTANLTHTLIEGIKTLPKTQLAELGLELIILMDAQSHIDRWQKVKSMHDLLEALKRGKSKLFEIKI